MARTNVKTQGTRPHGTTHEGAPAHPINAEQQLRRSVLACLLWEDTFYESGEDIAARIRRLAGGVAPEKLAALAIESREVANLRHVPLVLLASLASGVGSLNGKTPPGLAATTIERVIQRADELAELLAVQAKLNGVPPNKVKKVIPASMKRGLARAFTKFNEYHLAKYNRDNGIKLRDVLFMVHAKPKDEEQAALWKRLVAGEMATPDTWETQLSGGADKGETFTRLINEGKLGYLALLRNLRNMAQAGVDAGLVSAAIVARKGGAQRVLPFRYVAALRAAPQFAAALDVALQAAVAEMEPLPGKTAIVVDNSGSMQYQLSGKSEMSYIDAAATLASIFPGDVRVFVFSDACKEVPAYKGLAGVDAIVKGCSPAGTNIGGAVRYVGSKMDYDRIIVITDEQSHDSVGAPRGTIDANGKVTTAKGYMINVAAYKNGVGYGKWTHIDGFSENVIRFIAETEKAQAAGTIESSEMAK